MTTDELEVLLQQSSYRPKADKVQAYIEANPDELLPYLTERFIRGDVKGTSITSMVWGNIARSKPAWVQADQERVYRASLANPYPGVRRNVIRYFSEIPVLLEDDHPIPNWAKKKDFLYCRSSKVESQKNGPFYVEPDLEGLLLDHVLAIIADPQELAAPKAFGMQLVANLSLKYPEITHEVIPIIEEAMSYGSAGVKVRGKRALRLLEPLLEVL